MIAVGIDVSKSKSTVAILNGDGSIRAKPFNVRHTADELLALVNYIKGTSEVPTILMEPTSHYHYPLLKAFQEANLPVCLINPYQMKNMEILRFVRQKQTNGILSGLRSMLLKNPTR